VLNNGGIITIPRNTILVKPQPLDFTSLILLLNQKLLKAFVPAKRKQLTSPKTRLKHALQPAASPHLGQNMREQHDACHELTI
jgi:hypothetical protein